MFITSTLTACNDADETIPTQATKLNINVQTAKIETRGLIESATLPDGDAHSIGLTLVDEGGATYDSRTYNNVKVTPATTEGKQVWTPASDILLSSTAGTLYGYYPYSSTVADLTQVPVTAGETDYMYATPVEDVDDGNYQAAVTMNHALAAIRLSIVRGTYTGTGAVTSVSVSGDNIATAGKLNAKTGALTDQTGAGTALAKDESFTLSDTPKVMDYILVPMTGSAAPTFTITIDGKEYIATPSAVTLEQGSIYQYTLTVDAKDISLSDVTVGDWGYNDSGNPVIHAGYNITLAGDIEGIAFSNTINNDGSVTIKAVPNYVLPVAKAIAKADCSAGATCTQSLNELGGQTILLSNITQDITLTFNGIGDKNGVYAVTATGELIAYNDAAVDATCLGVALITDNQKIMIEKTESYDATNTTFYWGTNLYNKNVAGITDIYTADGTNNYGYLPKADGTYQSTPNLSGDYTTWTSGALSDFNGKNNTNAIITAYTEHSVDMDARDMCKVLQTFNAGTYGSNQGFTDWYIPACGQLALIYLNKTAINEALTAIGGTTFSDLNYWSSSEYSSSYGWVVNFLRGGVINGNKNNYYRVRFVRDYNEKDFGTIDLTTASNGVYAVAKNGKGKTIAEADESCMGVALIVNDATTPQRLWIEKNGEANTTSIQAAYTEDGAATTGYQYFYWGMYRSDNTSITNYTQTGGGGTSSNGYLPKADGTYHSTPNLSGDYTTWTSGALSDFNGKANTAALLEASDTDSYTAYANMATWCRIFNQTATENQGYTDWYIPACGQLSLMYLNMTAINNALTKIEGQTIASGNYWSSSESSSSCGWYVHFYSGYVNNDDKDCSHRVRFVRDF